MTQTRREPLWWGKRQEGHVIPLTLADAAGAREVSAFVATGARPGPTLVVLAGLHGDEYEGPVAIAELLANLSSRDVAGILITVPVAKTGDSRLARARARSMG